MLRLNFTLFCPDDGVMRTPKRCLKYDSTRNFHYHIIITIVIIMYYATF